MIRFNNVAKRYGNGTVALKDFNLEISCGKVVGILGPNGSGKTTLLKMINGYLKPTSGTIEVLGQEINAETKKHVSYLPDAPFIPEDYTVTEAKKLWQSFFEDFNETKFNKLMKFMDLDQNLRMSDMSKGMNEKFHLSLILSRDAKIYVIDEPIAGVDLVSRDKILEAIFSNIEDDKLLIIITHLVDELETLFDDVVFVSKGEIVLQGNAEDLRLEKGKQISDIFKEIYESMVY
ncbi:ABC transporter ATP-binding protein [Helcococcus kunzii]|uniref:ABC transporter ATP-binding protein n=1 Tax=Helcococcus kunzii TaxID=40091 RepID=UPI0024ACFA73|nr:ABC transporter ATP-binding protein [Helcococcus kunzii]